MKFYQFAPMGDINNDRSIAVVDGFPKGIKDSDAPVFGDSASKGWPPDVRAFLDPRFKGTKITSFLTNTVTYIMVTDDTKQLIATHCNGLNVEHLRFDLYNQKKRLHCKDCWVINPLGAFDCLSMKHSEIAWLNDVVGGEAVAIDRVVLDKKKAKNAPELFRVKEDSSIYVFGERLADDLRKHSCTNLVLTELEVA